MSINTEVKAPTALYYNRLTKELFFLRLLDDINYSLCQFLLELNTLLCSVRNAVLRASIVSRSHMLPYSPYVNRIAI